MKAWITETMSDYGYFGIFLLIALENLFPPIPSEVILTFGGFMTTYSDLTMTGVVIVSTLGSVAGAVVLYWIGALLGADRLERLVDKYGRILRLTPNDIRKANAWFTRYGAWAVFFCRFVPLIRSLISIPAGMCRFPFVRFLLLTTAGTLSWNAVLIWVGSALGASWDSVLHYMEAYSTAVYAGLAVLLLLFVFLYVRRRRAIGGEGNQHPPAAKD